MEKLRKDLEKTGQDQV